jgi:hypothetical protein
MFCISWSVSYIVINISIYGCSSSHVEVFYRYEHISYWRSHLYHVWSLLIYNVVTWSEIIPSITYAVLTDLKDYWLNIDAFVYLHISFYLMLSFIWVMKCVTLSRNLVKSFHYFDHTPLILSVFKKFCCCFSRIENKLFISWLIYLIWIKRWDQVAV